MQFTSEKWTVFLEGQYADQKESGIGAQFGGKHFCLDVRVIRLFRHGASCPVGIGVSCSADRQAKAKITRDGIFLEKLEKNPGRFIPERYRDWKFHGVPIDLEGGVDPMARMLRHAGPGGPRPDAVTDSDACGSGSTTSTARLKELP